MRRLFAAAALAVLFAAGCGGSPGDLIALRQSGGFGAGAPQMVVIQNNGESACNRGKVQDIGSKALLDARELDRELGDLADKAAVFDAPPGTPGVRSYAARTEKGIVRWQDRAPHLPAVLAKAQLMTLQLARKLC